MEEDAAAPPALFDAALVLPAGAIEQEEARPLPAPGRCQSGQLHDRDREWQRGLLELQSFLRWWQFRDGGKHFAMDRKNRRRLQTAPALLRYGDTQRLGREEASALREARDRRIAATIAVTRDLSSNKVHDKWPKQTQSSPLQPELNPLPLFPPTNPSHRNGPNQTKLWDRNHFSADSLHFPFSK